jgi:ribosomal protein L4
MPKNMRRNALLSSLTSQAKVGAIVGLESYPDTVKTKDAALCLSKMPLVAGKRLLIVTPVKHRGMALSTRNIPLVRVITAAYLNPEDVLAARHIIFFVDAIAEAERIFGNRKDRTERAVKETSVVASAKPKKVKTMKKTKAPSAKKSSSSDSSK